MRTVIKSVLSLVVVCSLAAPAVQADPPPWAPAHGYRNKNSHKHRYHRDYDHYDPGYHYYFGVRTGTCNREEIGTVLGGVIGGVVGSNAATDKTAGAIAGVIVGGVLGNIVGRSMDDADRYCTGHALEYAEDHQTVSWRVSDSNIEYHVTPVRTYSVESRHCREFTVTRDTPRGSYEDRRRACRDSGGQWQMIR